MFALSVSKLGKLKSLLDRGGLCLHMSAMCIHPCYTKQTMTSFIDHYTIFKIIITLYFQAVYMRMNRELNKQEGEDKSTIIQDSTSQPFKAAINDAVTYELCAGIVDKNIPLKSVMKEEVLEECGYNVPESHFRKVFSAWGSVGFAGSLQTLFFAEVTNDMKVNEGGGNRSEGEKIEVYYLPRKDVLAFLYDENLPKPPSLMAAFFWYLNTQHIK